MNLTAAGRPQVMSNVRLFFSEIKSIGKESPMTLRVTTNHENSRGRLT